MNWKFNPSRRVYYISECPCDCHKAEEPERCDIGFLKIPSSTQTRPRALSCCANWAMAIATGLNEEIERRRRN